MEVFAKMMIYYFHERAWDVVSIGRKAHPLSTLPVKKPLEKDHEEIIKNKLSELGYL